MDYDESTMAQHMLARNQRLRTAATVQPKATALEEILIGILVKAGPWQQANNIVLCPETEPVVCSSCEALFPVEIVFIWS